MSTVTAALGLRAFCKGFGWFSSPLGVGRHLELVLILLLSDGGSSWDIPQLQGLAVAYLTIHTSFSF